MQSPPPPAVSAPDSRTPDLTLAQIYECKLHQFVCVPVLIFDDFALKPLRVRHGESFHDLIAARYERAAKILTSNLDFGE
ncbi:ATP-binding protein [Burkholderia cepacia]|uniref:ATP-binding protein n=1 Tax=Burkholderia cepacia TaxID=292 RepID=UPI0038CD8891